LVSLRLKGASAPSARHLCLGTKGWTFKSRVVRAGVCPGHRLLFSLGNFAIMPLFLPLHAASRVGDAPVNPALNPGAGTSTRTERPAGATGETKVSPAGRHLKPSARGSLKRRPLQNRLRYAPYAMLDDQCGTSLSTGGDSLLRRVVPWGIIAYKTVGFLGEL
jgi:hypothetical protein